MPELLRFKPISSVPVKGRILFAARMKEPESFSKPANSLLFMAPKLLEAGYEVLVSNAVAFPHTMTRLGGIENPLPDVLSILNKEIEAESPDFLAFPAYDENAMVVDGLSGMLNINFPNLGFIYGGPFITINPKASVSAFGHWLNTIMINGEAEFALPEALDAYYGKSPAEGPGIYVRRNGSYYGKGDNFLRRASLTRDQLNSLSPLLDIQAEDYALSGGIDLPMSRGCFENCSFCAASNALRSSHVGWDIEKRMAEIHRAFEWMKARGITNKPYIRIPDDSFFYAPQAGIDFLKAFAADPISEVLDISLQTGFGTLFDSQGRFLEELPGLMLRKSGTPFVRKLYVGGDFWAKDERQRNKMHREGRLSNEQINIAVKAFTDKSILVQSYWLFGDEETTVDSFTRGALFLSELLIDFSPFFNVDQPGLIVPHTGTRIRDRIAASGRPIKITGTLGVEPNKVNFYSSVLPSSSLLYLAINSAFASSLDQKNKKVRPATIIQALYNIYFHWLRTLSESEKEQFGEYIGQRSQGRTADDIFAEHPNMLNISANIPGIMDVFAPQARDLLELGMLCSAIIPHYYVSQSALAREFDLRNPDFYKKVESIISR